ncbi:hypothetical protein V1506DRAFT_245762 [Lipomyces tetrasporus]
MSIVRRTACYIEFWETWYGVRKMKIQVSLHRVLYRVTSSFLSLTIITIIIADNILYCLSALLARSPEHSAPPNSYYGSKRISASGCPCPIPQLLSSSLRFRISQAHAGLGKNSPYREELKILKDIACSGGAGNAPTVESGASVKRRLAIIRAALARSEGLIGKHISVIYPSYIGSFSSSLREVTAIARVTQWLPSYALLPLVNVEDGTPINVFPASPSAIDGMSNADMQTVLEQSAFPEWSQITTDGRRTNNYVSA